MARVVVSEMMAQLQKRSQENDGQSRVESMRYDSGRRLKVR